MGVRESFLLDKLDNLINPATEETSQAILAAIRALFPDESIFQFNAIDTIAGSAQTTLVTYTNTTGQDIWLDGFISTGTVDACYALVINTAMKMEYRTSEQDRTAKVLFPKAIKVVNGDIVEIKVEHAYSFTADFTGTIIGSKYTV